MKAIARNAAVLGTNPPCLVSRIASKQPTQRAYILPNLPKAKEDRVALATLAQKAAVLDQFKSINKKYAKPFDQGQLANVSFSGGNWEEYGVIVLNMMIVDSLLQIEALLTQLVAKDI